ncbi:hypothetical protein KM043_011433 [Ampulex compressa]|nr:hypothetical protein KM043_011433 [Ampulex compressa]
MTESKSNTGTRKKSEGALAWANLPNWLSERCWCERIEGERGTRADSYSSSGSVGRNHRRTSFLSGCPATTPAQLLRSGVVRWSTHCITHSASSLGCSVVPVCTPETPEAGRSLAGSPAGGRDSSSAAEGCRPRPNAHEVVRLHGLSSCRRAVQPPVHHQSSRGSAMF